MLTERKKCAPDFAKSSLPVSWVTMKLSLASEHRAISYKVLTELVTPRPIAWVSTLNEDGSVNLAPYSFFNVFGSKPPLLIFGAGDKSPGVPKDTVRNILREKEYVINLVDEANAEAMNLSAASLPYGDSELELNGCSLAESEGIRTPRIAEAPAALECRLHSVQLIEENRIVLGLGDKVWVQDGILDPETHYLNPEAYQVIGRMQGPDGYIHCNDRFQMAWPKV